MEFGKSTTNFSYVALGKMIGAGLQAIFYFILAIFLEPTIYGELSYIIAIAGTGSIMARFGLNHTITVYQAKGESNLANQINVLALITICVTALIVLTIDLFSALLLLSLSFFVMNQHNLLGLKKYKTYMILTLAKNGSLLLIPLSLFFIFDISGILIGMAISNILFSFNFLTKIKKNICSFVHIKRNFRTILHNFGVDASINLSRNIDKLFIVPILGFTYVGIYQLNLQILFALEIIPLSLHSFLLSEEASGKTHSKLILIVIFISIILSVLLIIFSPVLIDTLFPKYAEGIPSLQILIISLIPLSISSIFNAKLQAKESTKIGYSALLRIGLLIVLIIILGNWYGLIGLSLSVLFSSIAYTTFLAILYYKIEKSFKTS